jgi:serine/threonine protein phosphatase PrpC
VSEPSPKDTREQPALTPGNIIVPASSRTQVDYAALSHPGLVRANNEDHFLLGRFGRSLETLLTNLPPGRVPPNLQEIGYGMLVADGLGGGAAGEVASELAILALLKLMLETPDWILSSTAARLGKVMRRMAMRFRRVSDVLNEVGQQHEHLLGMATTMTLACSLGPRLVLAHVGDSRAYLLRDEGLWQLTRDHTAAQDLVDAGLLREPRDAALRLQHTLTQVLGAAVNLGEPEVQQLALADGDQVLLCSDGLTSMVEDLAIAQHLSGAASAVEACQALVDAALRNGGKDNVTVVLMRYLHVGAA